MIFEKLRSRNARTRVLPLLVCQVGTAATVEPKTASAVTTVLDNIVILNLEDLLSIG